MKTTVGTKSTIMRHLLVSAIALGIMGLGTWSLLGLEGPYHPTAYDGDVSRDISSDILDVDDNN